MTQFFSLIEWPKPFLELYEFLGLFLALGAVGFRYTALRNRLGTGDSTIYRRMATRAAVIGAIGALLILVHIFEVLPQVAARAHTTVGGLLTSMNVRAVWFYLIILAVGGFALAPRMPAAWHLASVGVVAAILRNALFGDFKHLVTPVHILTGGLWIGTLFVLVVAGLATLLRDETQRATRGGAVADMVNRFSPLALTCGVLVVAFGVWAAFREFEPISAVWTTPRGYALIAKVAVVAVVFALGAWNWRRQRPALGDESAALSIRRSATWELAAAFLVLFLTSVMLSLPEAH